MMTGALRTMPCSPAPRVLPRHMVHGGSSHPDVKGSLALVQSLDNKEKPLAQVDRDMDMTAPEVAKALGVTRQRISGLTTSGRLDGCWTGEGRARRYDLVLVAERLNRVLDRGQMMGNGAGTKAAVRGILAAPAPQRDFAAKIRDLPAATAGDGGPDAEPDRYDAAKTVKMEEEARRLRRQNQEAERKYVLASAVESQVAKLMGQEIAETEAFLRQASRAVADKLGLDARAVRQIFLDLWRAQRQSRSSDLAAKAEAAELTDEEREADI